MESERGYITVGNTKVFLKVKIISHMMDTKAAKLYLGLGGAYCDLCDFPKDLCHDPDAVKQGFTKS